MRGAVLSPIDLNSESITQRYSGKEHGELLGWNLLSAGDLNGDGGEELLVGAPGLTVTACRGAVTALLGRSAAGNTGTLALLEGPGPLFGASLALEPARQHLAVGSLAEMSGNGWRTSVRIHQVGGAWPLETELFGQVLRPGLAAVEQLCATSDQAFYWFMDLLSEPDLWSVTPPLAWLTEPELLLVLAEPWDAGWTGSIGLHALMEQPPSPMAGARNPEVSRWITREVARLAGTEFGDRFGTSLAVADLDDDGAQDLIVSADTETAAAGPAAGVVRVLLTGRYTDLDGDGVSVHAGDCDDADPHVFPGQTEAEDERDNNCDRVIDEGYVACNGCGSWTTEGRREELALLGVPLGLLLLRQRRSARAIRPCSSCCAIPRNQAKSTPQANEGQSTGRRGGKKEALRGRSSPR